MTTNDTNKTADSRDPRGQFDGDHERPSEAHSKATVDQQRDAFVQKNNVEAQPISRTSGPPTNTNRSADGEIAVEGKNKTRPPSPGKRLFKGKFMPDNQDHIRHSFISRADGN